MQIATAVRDEYRENHVNPINQGHSLNLRAGDRVDRGIFTHIDAGFGNNVR